MVEEAVDRFDNETKEREIEGEVSDTEGVGSEN